MIKRAQSFGKRAQLEMIGIAIVVVLVIIGFLFVLKAISWPPSSTQAGFVRAHIGQDVLNTMSIADAGCFGIDMTEVLKACAEGSTIDCAEPCVYFDEKVKEVLEATLEEQKLAYRFRVYRIEDPPKTAGEALGGIFMEYGGCNETSLNRGTLIIKEKPGMIVVPTNAGDIKVMLEVCSNPY